MDPIREKKVLTEVEIAHVFSNITLMCEASKEFGQVCLVLCPILVWLILDVHQQLERRRQKLDQEGFVALGTYVAALQRNERTYAFLACVCCGMCVVLYRRYFWQSNQAAHSTLCELLLQPSAFQFCGAQMDSDRAPLLSLYSSFQLYCDLLSAQTTALTTLEKLKARNKNFVQYQQDVLQEQAELRGLDIEQYILKPVQRWVSACVHTLKTQFGNN